MSGPRPSAQRHWLRRPTTIRWLWRAGILVLAVTLLAQIPVHLHAWFGVDGIFGFYAVFGFLACVAMVVLAKVLGWLLKRPDSYYDSDD